jgi:hypothetical protein
MYLSYKNPLQATYRDGGTAADLNEYEAGAVGMVSGVISAVVTCPIDCINTRIKSGDEMN